MAQRLGKQDAIVETLFNAYFVDGVDVGDRSNLVVVAAAAGIEEEVAEKFMATEEGWHEVLTEVRQFNALGIDGVPGFVVNGQFLFSGAAEPHVMAEAFHQAVSPTTR